MPRDTGTSPPRVAHRGACRTAPHVRDAFSHENALRWLVIALIPSIVMAFLNTGFQANVNVLSAGETAAPGWRGAILGALSIRPDPSSFLAALVHGALYFLPILIVNLLVAAFWTRLFARLRKRPQGEGALVVALLFTLIVPPTIPLWQAALGMSFGLVVGREIFGGTGRHFLNPALCGLAFLYVTYPKEMTGETGWVVLDAFTSATYLQTSGPAAPGAIAWIETSWVQSFLGLMPGPFGVTSVLACLIGAAVLLGVRIASFRIMAGMLAGMVATALLIGQFGDPTNPFVGLTWYWHLVMGSFAFGAVFLATDPTSAAMTDKGRWIYGMLIGIVVVLIRVGNENHPDGVMFAILFGNIFAPLIDYLVMQANIRRRKRRHG